MNAGPVITYSKNAPSQERLKAIEELGECLGMDPFDVIPGAYPFKVAGSLLITAPNATARMIGRPYSRRIGLTGPIVSR